MRNRELRTGLIDALRAHTGLAAIIAEHAEFMGVAAVYDHVPQGTAFPYVVVGELEAAEEDTDDADGGWNVTARIHSWSRKRGRGEVESIGRQVDSALHRVSLTVVDARVAGIDRETSGSVLEADGLTRHGIQTYQVLLEEL